MITFCQMGMNRLSEVQYCFQKCLPYVDHAVYIDGGSSDDTIYYMRNWAEKEPKIKFKLVPWCDNFSKQRNEYLKLVPDNTWALIADSDEWFEQDLLQALPALIKLAESKGKDMVGFQCRSVSYKGPERVHESLDNYWKRLLFKKYQNTKYVGNPHEGLADHPHQIMDTKYVYEHIKQEGITWPRGMRNYFIGGGGPNLGNKNPYWIKLRTITSKLGINNWHDFEKYMLKGHIDQEIKDEFTKYITLTEIYPGMTDGLSELRECYKTYFRIWFPEEETPELKNFQIQ